MKNRITNRFCQSSVIRPSTIARARQIAAYSTPGLKKSELTRSSKKDQLLSLLGDRRRDEIEIILIELYGPEEEAQH